MDIRDYLQKMILQNLVFWPLILTAIIGIPVGFTYKSNLLYFLIAIHSFLVWWFAANLITNLYKIKKVCTINIKFSSAIIVLFFIAVIINGLFLEDDFCTEPLDFPLFKFIPLLGWLLEILSGSTTYIYQMYFGFIFATSSYIFFLYHHITEKYSPSQIREGLLDLAQNKNKANFGLKNLLKIPQPEIKTTGKFAAALHYKNLCQNHGLKFLTYFDLMSFIVLAFSVAFALAFIWLETDTAKSSSKMIAEINSQMIIYMSNWTYWFYLLARKEKLFSPDMYFVLIPARPQQKLNQLIRFGLIRAIIPVIIANLTLIVFWNGSPLMAVYCVFLTPLLYLFKCAINFILRIYLEMPPNGYLTFVQGLITIIIGYLLPSIAIAFIQRGAFFLENLLILTNPSWKSVFKGFNYLMEYGTLPLFYITAFALFYAYFDKIYRKIDFGRN